MILSPVLKIVVKKYAAIATLGTGWEKDESQQKYIVLGNIISINSACILFFSGILWLLLTKDKWSGVASIFSAVVLLFPIYLNARGRALLAKMYMVFFCNNLVLLCSCIFSFNTRLENYFFAILAASNFLFSYRERKWQYFSIIFSLFYYLIQVTSLRNYFPCYNLIKDFSKSNSILLFGTIATIILDVMAFIYITQQREKQLVDEQLKIKEVQHQLEMQHSDLETFSIAASHSLQTPIYVAEFFLQKARKNLLPDMPVKLVKNLDIINDSLLQMNQLVSGLFSYSHIINIEKNYHEFNITKELASIKKAMKKKFQKAQVIIPSYDFSIVTNRMLFSIIIQNLVDNGLKYNLAEQPVVTIQFERLGEIFIFLIRDNGIGIKAVNFEEIFEPFKRLDNNDGFKGTGLGLAGAKRAAERIGGKLFCLESSSGGSTFQLNIPYLYVVDAKMYPKV